MFSKRFIPLYLFVFTLVIYISNLSRSVYGGDVGDLVTAAYTGGIAHPPGYPLFTLLGWLLTRLTPFFPMTPAFLVGLISAFSSALGISLYYRLTLILIKDRFIAVTSSLILAFTYLFWFYAEIAEVFALNNLFAIALFLITLLFKEKKEPKYFYLLAFVAGLSFTNHQTIILIFPSLFILLASDIWKLVRMNKWIIAKSLLFLILGLSSYFYVFVASYFHPIFDWANLKDTWDFKAFFDLVLRKRYGTFQAGAFDPPNMTERLIILKYYATTVGLQLTLPVITVCLLGLIQTIRRNTTFAFAVLFAFVLTGPIFIAYAGFPLLSVFRFGISERFISLSAVILMFLFPFGLSFFRDSIAKVVRYELLPLVMGVFLIIPMILFVRNFPKTNLSNVWTGDSFGRDYIEFLPKNSIIFLSGDTSLFNTWYVNYALHVRPDVTVLNSLDPIQSNKILSQRFENIFQADSFNDGVIAMKQNIWNLATSHDIYSDIEMKGHKVTFNWVPSGLTSRLVRDKAALPLTTFKNDSFSLWANLHVPVAKDATIAEGNLTIADIPNNYANGLLRAGNYLVDKYDDQKTAEQYFKKSLAVQPDYENAYFALGAMYWSKQNNCDLGIKTISKAIDLNPTQTRFYQVLYIAMKSCKASEKEQKSLRDAYKKRFNTDLLKDIKAGKS